MIVQHLLFRGGAVGHVLRNTQLTVEHVGEILDLIQQIVLDRTIELSHVLSGVDVGDAVLRILELMLDVGATLFGLATTGFGLDGVRQLDQKIKLARTRLLVHSIQEVELPDESLQRGVRFVHHRVQRVLDDRHHGLRKNDLLSLAGSIIIDRYPNAIGKPLPDTTDTHGEHVKTRRIRRTIAEIDGNDGSRSFIENRHHQISDELTRCLVDVGCYGQAVVQITGHLTDIEPLLINPTVLNVQCRDIYGNTVVDR